jgi:hypothetical protein
VTGRLDDQDDILIPGAFEGGAGALSVGALLSVGFEDVGEGFTALVWRLSGGE